jgi:Kdo2-lipid IVA lauroyltransferase/acyltransferase
MRSADVATLGDLHRVLLSAAFGVLGPRAAYVFTRGMARVLAGLLPELQAAAEANVRAAMGDSAATSQIARNSLVHRFLNLTDLLLARRWLIPSRLDAIGGRIPQPWLDRMLLAQSERRPTILLTAYYGAFDLLPIVVGMSGVHALMVYRHHRNAGFDRLRDAIRRRGGCELVPVEEALVRLPRALEAGQTVGMLLDHEARRGVTAEFLGRRTTVSPAVGILAARHGADVIAAGLRRVGVFRFAWHIEPTIAAADFRDDPEAVSAITRRALAGLERIVRREPSQYLWVRDRRRLRDAASAAASPEPRSSPPAVRR